MGVTDAFQRNLLPSVCFLGHQERGFGSGYSRDSEKDAENPKKEIEKAERIRKEYFNDKK